MKKHNTPTGQASVKLRLTPLTLAIVPTKRRTVPDEVGYMPDDLPAG